MTTACQLGMPLPTPLGMVSLVRLCLKECEIFLEALRSKQTHLEE